jgi:hypothetical protein
MRTVVAFLMCFALLLGMTGCTSSPKSPDQPVVKKLKIDPDLLSAVTLGTKAATKYAFKKWTEKDPAAAAECAQRLKKNLEADIIPYFSGKIDLKTSAEVQAFLQASLFDTLPEPVKSAVIAAFGVLDYYLPIPDAKTYLNKDQQD